MAPDEPGARPAPVVLRIKLRYDDVDAMIQRFAPNVGKTGLFLPTKSIQPIGAEIKFELRLSNDQPVLVGLGRVRAAQAPNPDNPKATFGMAVELMRVTRESRDLILKMLERRKAIGLVEVGIPMPADIDAARRSDFVDTGVKDAASGAVPVYTPVLESAPSFTAPRKTGPMAVAKVTTVEPLAPEAPRKRRVPVAELIASASGPVATSIEGLDENIDVAAVLARARTLAGSDLDGELEALRDSHAAPLAEIDIEAASAELARQFGGAAVRKSARWAPPPKTSEFVATREPAPEPTPEPTPVAEAEPETAQEPAIEAAPDDVAAPAFEPIAPEPAATEIDARPEPIAPEPAATEIDAKSEGLEGATADFVKPELEELDDEAKARYGYERDDNATPIVEPAPPRRLRDDDDKPLFRPKRWANRDHLRTDPATEKREAKLERPPSPMIHDEADASQFEEAHEVEPEQIHDEIHRLEEGDPDFQEVEHTQIGGEAVDPSAFDRHSFATMPAEQAAIADRLDEQLAEAEEEGFSLDEPIPQSSDDYVIPLGPQNERSESLEAAIVSAVDEEEIEEIDDFEILAEADADDADLLTAQAEAEVSSGRDSIPPPVEDLELPPVRQSFLNRLDLGEDSGYHAPAAGGRFDDEFSHEPGEIDPRILSAGHALRAFEEPQPLDDGGDFNAPGTYTPIPRDPYAQSDDFDAPHGNYGTPMTGFVPPDAFDQSDVIAIAPESRGEEVDLETALEALDVDLDDLGAAHAPRRASSPVVQAGTGRNTGPQPRMLMDPPTARRGSEAGLGSSPTEHANPRSRQTGSGRVITPATVPKAPRVHKRATTEDGIVIDFDDDDQ